MSHGGGAKFFLVVNRDLRIFLNLRGQNFEKMVFLSFKNCIFRIFGFEFREVNVKS